MSKLDAMIGTNNWTEEEIVEWIETLPSDMKRCVIGQLQLAKAGGWNVLATACECRIVYEANKPSLLDKIGMFIYQWRVSGILSKYS